jgi:hypothetical protein
VAGVASAQTFVFDLQGAQEVPPVATSARGGCFGQFDSGSGQLAMTCAHNVVGATLMHIHRGNPGVSGPIMFDLGDPASPVVATWTGMTPADISDLLAGNLYIDVHSAGKPAGEIRGQILPRTVDLVNFTVNGTQVVPPNATTATGTCTADLDGPATSLAVQCTHDLAGAVSAHVHEGPELQIGSVVFTFASAASPLAANVPMTPQLVADFAAGFLYLDIHTAGSAELRGQIATPSSQVHLSVTAPGAATAGTPFDVTVSARDQFNNVVTGYTGTVHFTKTDAGAGSAVPADYTFVAADNGARTFTGGATLVTPGDQTITATDTDNATITGTSPAIAVTAVKTVSGPSATGSGTITATLTGGGAGCTFASARFIALSGDPGSPPAGSAPTGVDFPHGLFDFTATGCTPGSTITLTVTYPAPLAPGTSYWKYGPRPGPIAAGWYVLPSAVAGNTVTFSITDGQLGDDDLVVNGTIVDQGGPGAPVPVPTLSEVAMVLLALSLTLVGVWTLRRSRLPGA